MRNLKKFLALVLATLMVISAAATVSAYSDVADDSVYATAINTLSEYGIVKGIGNDEFGADLSVQRYQMALMMVRALEPESDWNVGGMKVFEDTPEELYGNYFGAIAYARMSGIINGVDDTHFAPADGIKYCDALIMAVRALGYTVDVTVSPYWMGAYQTATKLGLTKNIDVIDPAQILTRAQTAQVIYNMIKATPADGGATIEEKNFAVPGENNVTKYVITSTPKQYYATKTVETGFVGAQPLVNGVPDGDTLYIPVEKLGIEADEVENYFNYSVDLVNLNAKTGRYDKAILGAAPAVIYSNDVTIPDGTSKFVLNGTSYYPTAEFAGEALKNEIVIFNGGSTAGNTRILLTDSDGDVINENGGKVAIFAYQAPDGTKYYADKIDSIVISYAEALTKYGVDVSGTYTRYSTLKLADLKNSKNYQLTMFDDNGDQKFDRAIYTPVYMSVYPGSVKKDTATGIVGPAKEAKNVVIEGADLSKGDVFVYTWNVQTNTISVIEELETQVGTITNIDLTDYKSDKGYVAKITIDGVTYKLGNSAQDSKVGATLQYTTEKADGEVKFEDIADAKLNYVNNELTAANVIGIFNDVYATVRYIAFNGYIISAEIKSMDEGYEYMVVVSAEDYDTAGVYVDAYVNGKRGTYYINEYQDGDKTVKFSNLSVFKLNYELNKFATSAAGGVYKAVANTEEDAYRVSNPLTYEFSPELGLTQTIDIHTFKDGISNLAGRMDKTDRIRTDANTKFYFITGSGEDAKVTLYSGKPTNDWKIDGNKAYIYVDKIGYGSKEENPINGIASIVVVRYAVDPQTGKAIGITGFNVNDPANAIVYVANVDTYTVDSAANFELTGKTGTYFKYATPALNMVNGSTVTIYAKTSKDAVKPESGNFYEIDANGIIMKKLDDTDSRLKTKFLVKGDIDLNNQYITSNVIGLSNANKATKLFSTFSTGIDVKRDLSLLDEKTARKVVYLGNSLDDTIVLVVYKESDESGSSTDNGIANAVYNIGNNPIQQLAVANIEASGAGAISGNIQLYYDPELESSGVIGDTISGEAIKATSSSSAKYFVITKIGFKSNSDAEYEMRSEDIGVKFAGKYEKGVITIEKTVDALATTTTRTWEKGYYVVTFTVPADSGNELRVTITFDIK